MGDGESEWEMEGVYEGDREREYGTDGVEK